MEDTAKHYASGILRESFRNIHPPWQKSSPETQRSEELCAVSLSAPMKEHRDVGLRVVEMDPWCAVHKSGKNHTDPMASLVSFCKLRGTASLGLGSTLMEGLVSSTLLLGEYVRTLDAVTLCVHLYPHIQSFRAFNIFCDK